MVMTKKGELVALIETMIETAGSGHYASSMSALDIIYPLFYEQGVKPDEFILSKGHAAPALYAVLYDLGLLTDSDLQSFRKVGGLPGHPSVETPGVLCSSGSLGMGISKAVGLAWTNPHKTYHVLVGDGELQEGQNWEAFMYLDSHRKIHNIVIHVDWNNHQYSGEIPYDLGCWGVSWPNINIRVHRTLWQHDNSHLCTPKSKDYAYAQALIEAMQADERIVVLDADLKFDFGINIIERAYPSRFIECGISEQHMVSMAGGLARAGKIPICHTFGAFYRRAIDQLWNNTCDNICVGYVSGLNNHGSTNIGLSHATISKPDFIPLQANSIETFFETLSTSVGGLWLQV